MKASDRHNRVTELYLAAASLAPDGWAEFLNNCCGSDENLRVEIEAMLEADRSRPGFLETAALGKEFHVAKTVPLDLATGGGNHVAERGTAEIPAAPLPARIGEFAILEVLGEGGMGVVYLAEQRKPRRKVALKVLKRHLATNQMVRRFEREAELLARLHHAGIAQIFQFGTDGAGHERCSFFVMELVKGIPITTYGERHRLGTRARLALFAKVCDAVEHAHQMRVIHRDLKPSNILVDESGQPRVLDFGVARALDAQQQLTSTRTDVSELIGTMPYISPEHLQGVTRELDARTDVYALGVILYQILAGRLPYDLAAKTLPEAMRLLEREDPLPLSSIDARFRGDVETIVNKALVNDRAERYASAAELANDIRRYLRNEPIRARPPRRLYIMRKFARRHRGLVAGAGMTLVTLLLALALVTSQWQVARQREAEASEAVELLLQVLSAKDLAAEGRQLRYVDVLDQTASKLDAGIVEHTLAEAKVRHTLGLAYLELGLVEKAEPQLTHAYDIRLAQLDRDHPETLASMDAVGRLYLRTSQNTGTLPEDMLREVYERQRRLRGPDDPATLSAMSHLAQAMGRLHARQYVKAEDFYLDTLARCRRVLGDDDEATLQTMRSLGDLYEWLQRYDEAEPHLAHVYDVCRKQKGDKHPGTIEAQFAFGKLLRSSGQWDLAEQILGDTVRIAEAELPREHALRWQTKHYYGRLLTQLGRFQEAETNLLASFEGLEPLGKNPIDGAHDALSAIAELYDAWGKPAEGERRFRQLLRFREEKVGPRPAIDARNDLARTLVQLGRLTEAEVLFRQVLEDGPKFIPTHWWRGWFESCYGMCLLEMNRPEEAQEHLVRGFKLIVEKFGTEDRTAKIKVVIQRLIDFNAARGKTALAEAYREELARWAVLDDHARNLVLIEHLDELERYLIPRVERLESEFGPTDPRAVDALAWLARMYDASDKPDQAVIHYQRLLDRQRTSGAPQRGILETKTDIARMRLKLGNPVEADGLVRAALNAVPAAHADDWWVGRIKTCLGRCLLRQSRFDEGEKELLGALSLIEGGWGVGSRRRELLDVMAALVDLYEAWGNSARATEYNEKLATLQDDSG